MSSNDRVLRAEARRRVAILNKTRLRDVERDLNPVRGAEAISLVSQLTIESWSLGGRDIPAYSRKETQYRFVASPPV